MDGNRFLDFAAGIAVCATGHAHPVVVEAVKQAAGEVPAHLERLLAREHGRAGGAPRGGRADGRARDELPVPVRHRVGRGRAQARALRHRAAALHRLPRRLPRTHDGFAVVHLEQVHAAEGLRAHDARRHARPVSEHRTGRCSPAATRARPCSTTSACCSSATCRRPRSRRSWSSRSRARAAISCRPMASSPACARSATSTASCSSSTRCSRASAAPGRCSPASTGACGRTS